MSGYTAARAPAAREGTKAMNDTIRRAMASAPTGPDWLKQLRRDAFDSLLAMQGRVPADAVADYDEDGWAELVVPVGNGYVYGLDEDGRSGER